MAVNQYSDSPELGYHKIKYIRNQKKAADIFVSIASYRDPQLMPTLKNLYDQAKFPHRIRCFCLIQNDPLDRFASDPFVLNKNIDYSFVLSKHSKGVCWARKYIQDQYHNEPYFLQIDSHMRFGKHWDTKLIQLLNKTQDNKAILSCYPPGFDPENEQLKEVVLKTKPKGFDSNHSLILIGTDINAPAYISTTRHQLISAGYFFTYGQFCLEIPYDPYHYFQGEETDLTLRAYTRGWNCYAPEQCVIWHYYHDKDKNTRTLHWDEQSNWWKLAERSNQRILHKLGIAQLLPTHKALCQVERYSLGDHRTILDFEQEVGVNFKNKTILG